MIRCDRLRVDRGGVAVVDGVSLDVPAGRGLALIGRSGAGKSSLLAAAATAIPIHSGDVVVAGQSARRAAAAVRRLIGYVPDRMPDLADLRVGEFLELFATTAGLRGVALRSAVDRALAMADLSRRADEPLDVLPSGPAKRLLVASALLHDPQVLLLDDPFAGLDPLERADLERLLEDAVLMGRTVVAAIDDAVVPALFTDIAILREGQLVALGTAEPASFAAGRIWSRTLVCPGRAEDAARVLAPLASDPRAIDADTVVCGHDPARGPFAALVAAVVTAGIDLERADFTTPWTVQLLEQSGR
jgi:ABC-type multidrug transport system ATPase subunit